MARITLSTHWKFQRLARALGGKVLARGVLETLWEPCWVAGDAYCGTAADIEALCEWKGEAGALTKALLMEDAKDAGFIEVYEGRVRTAKERHYQIHDFLDHCPEYVRRRRDREMNITAVKRCAVCGDEFFSRNAKSLYCSHRCRSTAHRGYTAERDSPRDAPVTIPAVTVTAEAPRDGRVTVRDSNVTVRDGIKEPCVTRTVTREANSGLNSRRDGPRDGPRDGGDGRDGPSQYSTGYPDLRSPDRTSTPERSSTTTGELKKCSPAAPPASPIVLAFPTIGTGGSSWELREDQLAEWQALYPDLDVRGEARQALAWVQANQARRKTANGMTRYLVSWLNRAVDHARTRGPAMITGSLKTAGNQAAIQEFLRRRNVLD